MKRLLLCLLLSTAALSACDRDESTERVDEAKIQDKSMDEITELADKLPPASKKGSADVKKGDERLQYMGRFTTKGAQPTLDGFDPVDVEPAAVEELNLVAKWRVESAFAERNLGPKEVVMIQFGGEGDDGLQVSIRVRGKASSHKVVPANNGPELVTNFDHTLDRVLDELGIARKTPNK